MLLGGHHVLECFLFEKQNTKNFVCCGFRKIAFCLTLFSRIKIHKLNVSTLFELFVLP